VAGSSTATAATSGEPATRPRLRGWSHEIAFFLSIPVGIALCLETKTGVGTTAAVVFASTVVFMFGASAIYHRVLWRGPWRARMRRIDHVGIYALIAGSYTPFGLLVLHGRWQVVVLAIVWTGAAAAILFKVFWLDAPKWLSAAIAIGLGWVAVVVLPQIVTNVGVAAGVLVVAGGIAYTVGGLVYAFRRPDPIPSVFGYHELFHALVIVAVALQYGSIAFYVLPEQ
jgi:hemolysin III